MSAKDTSPDFRGVMALVKVRSAVGRVVLCVPVGRLKKAMLSVMLLGGELGGVGVALGLPGMSECILYTDTNSSVREYGMPWWSTVEPGIPLIASLVFEIRPTILFKISPAMPHLENCQWCVTHKSGVTYQFAFMLISSVGCAKIAGVHSLQSQELAGVP
jgi:hypothetical protein